MKVKTRAARASKASGAPAASASQAADVSITRQTTPIVIGERMSRNRATAAGRAGNPEPITEIERCSTRLLMKRPRCAVCDGRARTAATAASCWCAALPASRRATSGGRTPSFALLACSRDPQMAAERWWCTSSVCAGKVRLQLIRSGRLLAAGTCPSTKKIVVNLPPHWPPHSWAKHPHEAAELALAPLLRAPLEPYRCSNTAPA